MFTLLNRQKELDNKTVCRTQKQIGYRFLLTIALIGGYLSLPGKAQEASPQIPTVERATRQIARGVELVQEIIPETSPEGPMVITVLRINPKEHGTRVEAALGQDRVWGNDATMGREVVSTLATRRGAVAGINAGFFPFAGNPIGLHIENGQMVTEPANGRTVFLLGPKGEPKFARFGFQGTVRGSDNSEAVLSGMNRRPAASDGLLLYTPIFFSTTLRAPGRVEAVLETKSLLIPNRNVEGRVVQIVEGGNAPLAPGTVVLSAGEKSADWLRRVAPVGSKISFRLGVEALGSKNIDFSQVRYSVAGGPRLITEGRVTITLADEGVGQSFSTTRHPRTAVGVTKTGVLVLVTVDGRQKTLSRGASLPELANILLRYGAIDAMNLDGGGSSACIVRGLVVNSPSDGRERPIADALLVFGEPVKSRKTNFAQSLPDPLNVGDVKQLGGPMHDTTLVWGLSGGMGFVSQNGVFRALRPGQGVITLSSSTGKVGSLPVTVGSADTIHPAAEFTVTLQGIPDTNQPNQMTLLVRISNPDGDPLANTPIVVTVLGGHAITSPVETDAKGLARVRIVWDAANVSQSIVVSSPTNRFASSRVMRRALIPKP